MWRRQSAGGDAPQPPPGRLETALSRRHRRRLARAALLAPRRVDPEHVHIAVRDPDACAVRCPDRCCTYLCPAAVFDWRPGPSPAPTVPALAIRHERCVECGACRLFCPLDNVELDTPRGGYGIFHRYG